MITKVPSPIQILFVDRLLRGKKGDAGITSGDSTVTTHENMYDHGQLHAHDNKGLLDFLSLESGNLAVNGISIVDAVLATSTMQGFANIASNYNQLTLANIYLFTVDYSFVSWLETNHLEEYGKFIAAGLIPAPQPQPQQGG